MEEHFNVNNLSAYGWNAHLEEQKRLSAFSGFLHGRVTVTHKTCYEVVAETGTFSCQLTGNLLYGGDTSGYPCTGDWVLFQEMDVDKGVIFAVLPRCKALYRTKVGSESHKQLIASFVDKAVIVQGLDTDVNVRRIERMMVQIADAGISPVLVLNKCDLEHNKEEIEAVLKHLGTRIPVFYTSIYRLETVKDFRKIISPGETIVLIGLSGSGKSSLANALCGNSYLETSSISESTGKGRHTSTRRELLLLEEAGVLIDTPGIKQFGITSGDESQISDILGISDFEGQCRFSDCQHTGEAGCAVLKAVEEGELEEGIYNNYLRMRREAIHYTTSVHERRKSERSFSKMVKGAKNYKNNNY